MAMSGERNAAGFYRYWCDDCGEECTVGLKKGPPHSDAGGLTRCAECYRVEQEKRSRLERAGPALLAACKAALGLLEARARERQAWQPGDVAVVEQLEAARAAAEK
jgi:hypothetical protein